MNYNKKLVIRLLVVLILFIIPVNIFYFMFLKPTLVISFLTLGSIYNPTMYSDALIINKEILRFVPACIATSAYYLLAILLLFTKDLSFKKMGKLFVFGAVAIFLFNIIRIDLLIYVLVEYGVDWFNKLHLFIWRFLSTIFVVLLWIFMTKKFRVKGIPFYSDLKCLIKKSRRK